MQEHWFSQPHPHSNKNTSSYTLISRLTDTHPLFVLTEVMRLKSSHFFYQVFLFAYEEIELNPSISVDRQSFKQSVNHLQQHATLLNLGQDTHYLHWDV